MENKALYVLAGYEDETEKNLSAMQEKLYASGFEGVQTKNIPMHITLGSFPCEKESELKNQLEQIAQKTKAFDVTVNHVGIFGGSDVNVLFVAPDINRPLLDLKENFGESFDWTPHTTLLIDKSDIVHKAVPNVMADFHHFVAKVSVLYLYEFWPARHILTVHLNG